MIFPLAAAAHAQLDLTTRIIYALIDQWPFVIGLSVVFYKLFPYMLRNGLSNGSGDVIRSIVKSENADQTKHYSDELDRRFEKHEAQEDRRFTRIEDEVFHNRRR